MLCNFRSGRKLTSSFRQQSRKRVPLAKLSGIVRLWTHGSKRRASVSWVGGEADGHLKCGRDITESMAQYIQGCLHQSLTEQTREKNTVTWLKSIPTVGCQRFPSFIYLISSQILLPVLKKVNTYQGFHLQNNKQRAWRQFRDKGTGSSSRRPRFNSQAPTWWLIHVFNYSCRRHKAYVWCKNINLCKALIHIK